MKLNIRNKKKKRYVPTTEQRVAQYIDQVISFTSPSFSRPFLSIQSGVFLEKYFSRRSSCAQWTTAAWCPRSSGSTPPRTTSPSPWSRCCFLAKILLMFKLHSHIQSRSPAQTAASPGDPHIHLIPSVLPSHSGTYSCVAENVLGQVTSSETKMKK